MACPQRRSRSWRFWTGGVALAATLPAGCSNDTPQGPYPTSPPPVAAASPSVSAPFAPSANETAAQEPALVDFADPDVRKWTRHQHGTLTWDERGLVYRLLAGQGGSIVVRPAGGHWDVRDFNRLVFDMAAGAGREIKLKVMARNPGATDWSRTAIGWMFLDEGQRSSKPLHLLRRPRDLVLYPELKAFEGMMGLPGGFYTHWLAVDPANIVELSVSVTPKPYPQELRLFAVRPQGPVVPDALRRMGEAFFPFIDTYGQDRHATWPGKIFDDADLRHGFAVEQQDLASHPPPADRNRWGGWKHGPRLDATGFFRTEKIGGVWWLVDPDGQLFWSHGVTGVGLIGARTPIAGREHYFTFPDETDPLHAFGNGREFDFTAANLRRALGEDWQQAYRELAHQRLASWGMNTLGMWSQPEVAMMRRTPYTVAIHYGYAAVSDKLPDPFDPGFRTSLRNALARFADTAGDPWCIGYFVNNELRWSKPMPLAQAVLSARPDSAAKQRLVELLSRRHGAVQELNGLLGTDFADWEGLLNNTRQLNLAPIAADVDRFYQDLCETYFRICREEVKRLAPSQLYLGCRFNQHNAIVMAAAARYCDVISYNLYEFDISTRRWEGVDKPFIASEFHFAAQDRGMWGLGLRWASSQEDRARLYRDYVRGALDNPLCVGTHWFQYNSQAFTGRADGENHQVGLTDIGGRPWPELRDALREVGDDMYPRRSRLSERVSVGRLR